MKKILNRLNFRRKKEEKSTEEIVIEVLKNFYFITYAMRKKIIDEGKETGDIIRGIGMDVTVEKEFTNCTEILTALDIVLRRCLGVEITTNEIEKVLESIKEEIK